MATEEIITQDDNPHALIVRAPDERSAILLMDRMDLDQAMAELRGEVLEGFVYAPKGGKNTLSYAGIKEAARLYRNVHFGASAVPLPDGSWMITSYAHNLADNVRVDYPMPYPAFNPRDREAAIEFRASLSKSLRNALAAVLPVAYLSAMITRWMEHKGAGPAPAASAGRTTGGAAPPLSRGGSPPAPARTAERASVPASAAEEAATDWTQQQLGARIRLATAGAQLQTLAHWQALARTYGVPAPASGREMTKEWLLGLYQAMQTRQIEERIRQAGDFEQVRAVMMEAIGLRDRREISMEQYSALDEQADAHYAELAAPAKYEQEQQEDPLGGSEGAAASDSSERVGELRRQITRAASEQEIAAALAAAQDAKDAGQITQEHRVGLLRMADTRRAALSGPLTAQMS